jgi:hypothetical protein
METATRKKSKKSAVIEPDQDSSKKLEVAVDFPQEGESIWTGHYAIRLSGTPNAEVEVSINNGDWKACRAAVGYYWHDWWADGTANEIAARIRVNKGKWQKSKVRQVKIASAQKN